MSDKWITKKTIIERIEMVGPRDEFEEALRWLYDNGYNTRRSGPYTDKAMYPNVDVSRFKFVAEKEL